MGIGRSIAHGIFWLALTAPMTHGHAQQACGLQQGSDTVSVIGTPWVVAVRGYACGFGIGVTVDLAAINTNTKAVTILAEGDDLKRESMYIDKNGGIIINIPNTSDILIRTFSFDGINVIYRFYPYDDPEERKRYFDWTHDRQNETNRIWYCTHILPKMTLPYQQMNDEVLAYSIYGPNSSHKSYCKPS